MAEIKEDYVSFEIAKLLKEKGFGGNCLSMYVTPKPHSGMGNPNEAKLAPHGRDSHYYEGYIYQCEAPTQQMAMHWLREKHYLWIDIDPSTNHKWTWSIWFMNDPNLKMGESSQVISTYEEAVEVAIQYSLKNLI